jgi:hypothetical protein
MEQAVAQFSNFPQNPKERSFFVEKCVDEITSGNRNPLDFELMLKNLEDTISSIRKDERVKNSIQDEVQKYSEKSFMFGDYEITKSQRTTYDYSNDETWVELKEQIKKREELLKAINPKVDEIADGKTGAMINPPLKKQSDYLTIKYKG